MMPAQEHRENLTANVNKARKQNNPLMIFITILLLIQVLISGYQTYARINDDLLRAKVTSSVAQYTASLDELTSKMLADYKTDVYNNPNVDSTAKQAIMSSEYSFNAVLLLVKQNNRLLELLTQIK